jgi:hypothetical protein
MERRRTLLGDDPASKRPDLQLTRQAVAAVAVKEVNG